jgi:hypothetical protein
MVCTATNVPLHLVLLEALLLQTDKHKTVSRLQQLCLFIPAIRRSVVM